MAEIIHLQPGVEPPVDEKYILFEWKPSGERESIRALHGSVQRVPDGLFDGAVAGANKMADDLGYQKVYVRGRPK